MTCIKRLIAVGAVLAFGLLGASSAFAAKPTHETSTSPPVEFPAGFVCEFPIQVSAQTSNVTTFFDRQGNPVRILITHFSPVTVTNADTGKSITVPHGAAFHSFPNPDGSQTLITTGHALVAAFPTDVGGPSLTLYSGRVVQTLTANFDLTAITTSGKSVDMCAALSG